MDLVTRAELPGLLNTLGMPYGSAGLEVALRAVGIKPTRYEGVSGGKGRISLFDPIVAWVIVAAWESNKRSFKGLDRELAQFEKLYDRLSKMSASRSIPGFVEDRQLGVQLLMLTSLTRGLEPREIRRIVRASPKALDYCQFGRSFSYTVLQAYNNVYGIAIAELSVDPAENEKRTVSQQLEDFAERWLREAALWFEAEKHNASDEANR